MNKNLGMFFISVQYVHEVQNIHNLKFPTNWTKHCGDIGMLKSLSFLLRNGRAVGEIIGYLSEIKLVTSLFVSSRNAGNLKLFWFQVHSELRRKTTQNQTLALSSSPRLKTLKRMAYKNEKRMLHALETFTRLR